jgi:adenosylcobinamide-GDP ribazoletransferase
VSSLLGAVAFLTRVPVRTTRASAASVERSVAWFPVVGALVGLAVAAGYALALLALPRLPAAALAVAAGVVVTGALHEDGLADVADAFGAGRDREQTSRILDDPRVGTFGALAVAASFVLRTSALAALGPRGAAGALAAAHALSRAAMVGLLHLAPGAGRGLGARYAPAATRSRTVIALASGAALGAVALGPWALAAGVLAGGAASLAGRAARRKIGGITGDVLGAAQQGAEAAVLLLCAAVFGA